jgi:hypothetical protein
VSNTLSSVTRGNSDNVNDLVLLKHALDVDRLLEMRLGEFDLVSDGSTVDLDLHQVGLFLDQPGLPDLGVGEDSDDGTVLPDSLNLSGDRGTVVLRVLLGVLGESLLLGPVPVLVEPSLQLVRQVFGPDGGQRSETSGGLDVSNDTDDNHGGSLDDGGGLDDFSLVHLCGKGEVVEELARVIIRATRQAYELTGTGSVQVTNDVGHTSLVTHEGGKVDRLGRVILRRVDERDKLAREIEGACRRERNLSKLTLGKDFTLPLCRAARFRGKNLEEAKWES